MSDGITKKDGIDIWGAMAASQDDQGGEPFDLTEIIVIDDLKGEILSETLLGVANLNGSKEGGLFF